MSGKWQLCVFVGVKVVVYSTIHLSRGERNWVYVLTVHEEINEISEYPRCQLLLQLHINQTVHFQCALAVSTLLQAHLYLIPICRSSVYFC